MFIFFYASCTSQKIVPVSEETYIKLLVEMEILKVLEQTATEVPETGVLFQEIIQSYGYTIDEFRISDEYYRKNTDAQKERMVRVVDLLNEYQGNLDRLLKERREKQQADHSATNRDKNTDI